jgi:hypothetical protein
MREHLEALAIVLTIILMGLSTVGLTLAVHYVFGR